MATNETAAFTGAEFDFKNTEKPLEDVLITRITSKMTQMKRQLTNSIKKAHLSAAEISKLRDAGMGSTNLLLTGMIRTGAGHIEVAQSAKLELDKATSVLISILEEVRILKPDLDQECNTRIDKADTELESYETSLTKCISETVVNFENSGHNSAQTSRENSPSRATRRFINMKHLLPVILGEDCNTLEFRKFKREFDTWLSASYPDGHQAGEMWGTLNSRLDATWQDRLLSIEGIQTAELAIIWTEMDKIMMTLHPTHTRRMKFLSMKPTKSQTPSNFIHRMKEEAIDAKIHELTDQSLILHLTTAGLPPSDINKAVKSLIIEELRVNPNLNQKDMKTIVAKIKGIEADYLAVGEGKILIRKTENTEWKHRLCQEQHERGKCAVVCSHCKRRGSHKSDDCWNKKGGKDKRDRSESRNRDKGRDGRRMKPKKSPIRKARRTRDSDTETERDSSAPSDTDQEETPPKEEKKHTSRKVKSILKSSVRRTKSRALAEQELHTNFSSEDSESEQIENISEKLLNAYKKKIKV